MISGVREGGGEVIMLLVLNVDTAPPPTCLWHGEVGSFVPPDSTIETREPVIPPVPPVLQYKYVD